MIVFCRYTLRSRGSLNAVSQRREFHGALIKVDDGIGCLHPWPEFGDAPVEEQLRLLRAGGTSKVIERALRMASVDGDARRRGMSLFAGLEIPPSHYSWDQNQPVDAQMQRVISEGWRAIKMKGSPKFEETLEAMDSLVTKERLRVDFNSCLTAAQFAGFVRAMPPSVRDRLDFIEDPFPYDASAWRAAQRALGVRLACDKGLSASFHKEKAHSCAVQRSGQECPDSLPQDCGYGFAVLKPGRRDWRETVSALPAQVRIVMTSAMDHAIGQCFAAYEAALAWKELGARLDLCGLCTEHLFERDAFSERLSSHGGALEVDRSGTGLGFDEVIANLPWKDL